MTVIEILVAVYSLVLNGKNNITQIIVFTSDGQLFSWDGILIMVNWEKDPVLVNASVEEKEPHTQIVGGYHTDISIMGELVRKPLKQVQIPIIHPNERMIKYHSVEKKAQYQCHQDIHTEVEKNR